MKKLARAEGPRWYSRCWQWLKREADPLQVILAALGVVLAALGVVAAVVFGLPASSGGGSSNSAGGDSPPPASAPTGFVEPSHQPTSSGSTSTTESRPSPAVAVGVCYRRDSGKLSVTPCSNAHHYEVIAAGRCSYSSALQYVGGQSGLDVLGGRLEARAQPGWCLLSSLRETTKGSVKGVFDSPSNADDVWRRCQDTDADRTVPCDDAHAWEYVATGTAGESSGEECRDQAEVYMDKQYGSVDEDLSIVPLTSIDSDILEARCVLVTRGSGRQLSASLRWLRDGQVPFTQ